mgnify:CR=1 FL=1
MYIEYNVFFSFFTKNSLIIIIFNDYFSSKIVVTNHQFLVFLHSVK